MGRRPGVERQKSLPGKNALMIHQGLTAVYQWTIWETHDMMTKAYEAVKKEY